MKRAEIDTMKVSFDKALEMLAYYRNNSQHLAQQLADEARNRDILREQLRRALNDLAIEREGSVEDTSDNYEASDYIVHPPRLKEELRS